MHQVLQVSYHHTDDGNPHQLIDLEVPCRCVSLLLKIAQENGFCLTSQASQSSAYRERENYRGLKPISTRSVCCQLLMMMMRQHFIYYQLGCGNLITTLLPGPSHITIFQWNRYKFLYITISPTVNFMLREPELS